MHPLLWASLSQQSFPVITSQVPFVLPLQSALLGSFHRQGSWGCSCGYHFSLPNHRSHHSPTSPLGHLKATESPEMAPLGAGTPSLKPTGSLLMLSSPFHLPVGFIFCSPRPPLPPAHPGHSHCHLSCSWSPPDTSAPHPMHRLSHLQILKICLVAPPPPQLVPALAHHCS